MAPSSTLTVGLVKLLSNFVRDSALFSVLLEDSQDRLHGGDRLEQVAFSTTYLLGLGEDILFHVLVEHVENGSHSD